MKFVTIRFKISPSKRINFFKLKCTRGARTGGWGRPLETVTTYRVEGDQCDQILEKSCPNFIKSSPKSNHNKFYSERDVLKRPKKSRNIWATFIIKKLPRNSKNCTIWSHWVTNYWKSFYYFATQPHFHTAYSQQIATSQK